MTEERDRLEALARPHATISDKIRALAAAGVPRADIARFLGKRYQHVRNVLEGDAQAGRGYVLGRADVSGVQEPGAKFEGPLDEGDWVERRGKETYWLTPRPDGSLVLPKEVAEALGVTDGHRVQAIFRDGELRMVSFDTAFERARAIISRCLPPGGNLVDEFIAERRAIWGETDDD